MQSFCAHLTVYQSQVRAGREFSPGAAGWSFLRVCGGRGHLLNGSKPSELETGDLVVIPAGANVGLRASQLGDMRLCGFGIRPEQLIGFFTAEERQALHTKAATGTYAARVFKQEDAVARQHAALCEFRRNEPGVLVRSTMLSLAVQGLRDILTQPDGNTTPSSSPEKKLADLLARLPESELLSSSTRELARQCGCTERHFRRLFAGRFKVSLKRRQIEWRIEQSKKLLLETDAKVIDIASRCGFRSLAQFNLTFKRMTRMTPSRWRESFAATAAKYRRRHPSVCPRQNQR